MGINSTEVAYGFGQLGSGFMGGTTRLTPPSGMVIIVIISIDAATAFEELIPEVTADAAYAGTATQVALNGGGSDDITSSNVFKVGMPLYGRWTSAKLTDGAAVVYFGK